EEPPGRGPARCRRAGTRATDAGRPSGIAAESGPRSARARGRSPPPTPSARPPRSRSYGAHRRAPISPARTLTSSEREWFDPYPTKVLIGKSYLHPTADFRRSTRLPGGPAMDSIVREVITRAGEEPRVPEGPTQGPGGFAADDAELERILASLRTNIQ